MTAGRCHAPIERLTDLGHHKELVQRMSAQRPKNRVPARRQGNHRGADQFRDESPRIDSLNLAIAISAGGSSLLCSLAFQRRLICLDILLLGITAKQEILGRKQERDRGAGGSIAWLLGVTTCYTGTSKVYAREARCLGYLLVRDPRPSRFCARTYRDSRAASGSSNSEERNGAGATDRWH